MDEVIWAAFSARLLDNICEKACFIDGKSVGAGVVLQASPSQESRPIMGSCIRVVGSPVSDLPSRNSVEVGEGAIFSGEFAIPGEGGGAVSWFAMESSSSASVIPPHGVAAILA